MSGPGLYGLCPSQLMHLGSWGFAAGPDDPIPEAMVQRRVRSLVPSSDSNHLRYTRLRPSTKNSAPTTATKTTLPTAMPAIAPALSPGEGGDVGCGVGVEVGGSVGGGVVEDVEVALPSFSAGGAWPGVNMYGYSLAFDCCASQLMVLFCRGRVSELEHRPRNERGCLYRIDGSDHAIFDARTESGAIEKLRLEAPYQHELALKIGVRCDDTSESFTVNFHDGGCGV